MEDERKLIERAQSGDARAFEELIGRHIDQVRRFARGFAPTAHESDDLAQEALVKAYLAIRSYRYQSAFSTWLFRITRNVCIDHARSRRGKQQLREDAFEGERHADETQSQEERVVQEQLRVRVWAALEKVPVKYRSALILFDIEGLSYEEIAAVESVPVGTVRSRINRGRAHLKKLLARTTLAPTSAPPARARSRTPIP